jgi:hypothetical protein
MLRTLRMAMSSQVSRAMAARVPGAVLVVELI